MWNNKTSLADSMLRDGLVSSEWVYKNVFNFTDKEIKDNDEQIIFDYKTKFRRQQIEAKVMIQQKVDNRKVHHRIWLWVEQVMS